MKKRWMSVLLVVILAGSVLTLGSCAAGQNAANGSESAAPSQSAEAASPDANEAAASGAQEEPQGPGLTSFSTVDLDGNAVTQDVFADYDITMVNIWATFCSPCIGEMPELGQLKAEYADKGVSIVGIVVDVQNPDGSIDPDMVQAAKDIVAQTGADYTHLLPSQSLNDALLSGVSAVPTTVFVDSKGNILQDGVFVGAHDKGDWQSIIDGLMTQNN